MIRRWPLLLCLPLGVLIGRTCAALGWPEWTAIMIPVGVAAVVLVPLSIRSSRRGPAPGPGDGRPGDG